jgi:hypothetical protein
MKRFLVAVPVLLGLLSIGAAAQSVATAELHVMVKDPNGRLVTNAKVTVRDESRGIERTLENRPDGEYPFLSLPPGQYMVTVEAGGFARATAVGVQVTVGQAAELPVTLSVSGQKTEVTVSGETEMVETQQTSVSTTINQQRIDNLPINGRNYINFTLLNSQTARDNAPSIGAAPTSGLNIGGQRARANLVNVDGMDAVDNSTNGVRSTVSQEAVQEFQLITNGYAAEYGRASGGVVNIITRSGTNALHGSAYGYLRNRDFQAINPFSSLPPGETPAYTRVQAGFTLGGALKKDKTFYFLSYETTRRQETGFSTIGDNFGLVPLANPGNYGLPAGSLVTSAQAAFLAAAPVNVGTVTYAQLAAGGTAVALQGAHGAPGPLGVFPTSGAPLPQSFANLLSQEGNYPVSEGTSIITARLDHKFNSNHSGMLRANVSPSTVTGLQVQGQNQNFGQNAFSRTAIQQFRDFAITAQETATLGNNKINELRFQYARRGLLFNFNQDTPDGPNVAVNIQGYAFIGREPFSSIRRTEQRYQVADNFSVIKGTHNFKVGADFNHLPVAADFAVNFGGVYNFGDLTADTFRLPTSFPSFPAFQAYGLGIPQTYIQGVGNPHASFSNTPLGFFAQDSWRIKSNLTLNYGVRYDVELAPTAPPLNALSTPAYAALGITNSIPQDNNNVAPRIGLAWDPWKNGKTVVRASYGLFYDHPLLGLQFLAQATDAVGTPQILLAGGNPCGAVNPNPLLQILNSMNATNTFQGTLGNANCLGSLATAFGYDPTSQRFVTNNPASLWVNQNFLQPTIPVAPGVNFPTPLGFMPFGFPLAANFQYAYSNQANLSIERDLGGGFALNIAYNFNGGRHLNRPINANAVHGNILFGNYVNDLAGGNTPSNPLTVSDCGIFNGKTVVPAALVNFFRPSGLNPSLAPWFSTFAATGAAMTCTAFAQSYIQSLGLGVDAKGNPLPPIPFSDMAANYSNGSSVYHGLTINLRKRFTRHYEFLVSYTYSHAIDDSTDLESPLSPQDAYNLRAERSNSTFDQRHRLVLSGVYQSGKVSGSGFVSRFFSDWTVAPIIEAASGRPFTVITAISTRNFQFSPNSARPNVFTTAPAVDACGDPAVQSPFIPGVWFQLPCPANGQFDGDLGRNSFTKPSTVFTDLRIARRIRLTERLALDGMMDAFNLINKFDVADVNPLYTEAGQPTAAYDPRQFQFALKLSW